MSLWWWLCQGIVRYIHTYNGLSILNAIGTPLEDTATNNKKKIEGRKLKHIKSKILSQHAMHSLFMDLHIMHFCFWHYIRDKFVFFFSYNGYNDGFKLNWLEKKKKRSKCWHRCSVTKGNNVQKRPLIHICIGPCC